MEEETDEQGRTQPNTMAVTAAQGGKISWKAALILTPEGMRQTIASRSGGIRKPQANEPEIYRGERHKLRAWLAQLIVHYRMGGWQDGHTEKNILYATSLLRDDAGTWLTPYAEE